MAETTTLAFDVYGTLINTNGVVANIKTMIKGDAGLFADTWRAKQLEYAFRRGLMERYQPFSVCTSQALDYTCAFYQQSLSVQQKQLLLECYRTLPSFADVVPALTRLQEANFRLFAFSNGSEQAVDELLTTAGIRHYFADIVSVDDVRSFKPNPAVYHHFLAKSKSTAEKSWLVSGNPFDVLGALAAGLKAAWVQRTQKTVFDPWDTEPTVKIESLQDLADVIAV